MYPWERREKEGDQAYAAFLVYRDLGREERSCARVGQELGKSTTLTNRWSSQWQWVARAAAWDEEQQKSADAAALEAIGETNRAVHAYAVELRNRAVLALRAKPLEALSVQELLVVLDTVDRHDRRALGVDPASMGGKGRGGSGPNGNGTPTITKVLIGVDPSKI